MALDKNKIIAEATKLVQKGAYDKAIRSYEKILTEDPKDVRILLKIGELHQKKNDDGAAARAFQKVAETYAEQGFFLKAVAVYKQIVKIAPDDVGVNERLAGLYQQLGLMSDAMAQLQVMATAHERQGDGARLADVLGRMVELDPENIASSIKLGEMQARGGQTAQALDCFRRAADHLKKHNRADEYLKVAERIAVLTPDDLQLTRELAHIYLAKGDTKRALAKLQLCFKAEPKDVETLQLLAQAFRDLGQTAKTLSVYKELARVHEERGRGADARAVWRKVLEVAPDDEEAAHALGGAHAAATPAPAFAGHPAATSIAAIAPPPAPRAPPAGPPPGARAAIAPPPPPAAAPRTSGAPGVGRDAIAKLLTETDVYVKYGLQDKALDHLRKVLAIDPESPDAHEKAREIHVAAGRTAEAAASAARAVRALVGRGLPERAREALGRLKQIAPTHPDVSELDVATGGTGEVVLIPVDDAVVLTEAEEADDDALALAAAGHEGEEIVDEEGDAAHAGAPVPVEIVVPEDDVEIEEAHPDAAEAGPRDEDPIDEPLAPAPPRTAAPAVTPRPPAARKPAPPPPPARAAEPDLADELEEAEFFVEQGLLGDARDALRHLLAAHPGHRAVGARLAEIERRLAAGTSTKRASDDGAAPREAKPLVTDGADESFDIARELAEELGGEARAPAVEDEFQYSVEDVFNQFKKGVEQTVRPEDSATHYDLGIAYKEMALLDDAIHEFETALKGNDRKREIDCLSMIGLCRMAKGEAREAIRAFRRALAAASLTREAAKAIQYELGAAYEAAGEGEVGLWFLQRVAKADPAFRDVAARVQALGGGPGRPPPDVRAPAARANGAVTPPPAPARANGVPAPPRPAPAAAGRPASGAKKNIGYL